MAKEEEKEVEEKVEEYHLVEVPTGSAIAIKTPEGKVLTNEQALVEVLNILKDIKIQVG